MECCWWCMIGMWLGSVAAEWCGILMELVVVCEWMSLRGVARGVIGGV